MTTLVLHELHHAHGAAFLAVNGAEAVADHGDAAAELAALRGTVGVLDLSHRSRLCVLGADRVKFLHGQVTNDVQRLRIGEGCYAALVNAKGRMVSDLDIYRLADELLLDFEPGYTAAVMERLEKHIITEDVQLIDAAPHYGLLSVQGPRAAEAIAQLALPWELPAMPLAFCALQDSTLGMLYLIRRADPSPTGRDSVEPQLKRSEASAASISVKSTPSQESCSARASSVGKWGSTESQASSRQSPSGFDLFIPTASLGVVFDKLLAAAKSLGGRACGWHALETARIAAGIPRFGQDMDEASLPPEGGIESRAISYNKGCYIGQEVIARIRTYGQVAKSLRQLRLPAGLAALPAKGDKLLAGDKEVGHLTSVIPGHALGYVRKEHNAPGMVLTLLTAAGACDVTVI
ncbi:MAG: aminomethyl transferase family protein [Verrucomicrobia bacterium]|nr:aminomethyl transferase family protein [Verrucomicrobiota bacterium]